MPVPAYDKKFPAAMLVPPLRSRHYAGLAGSFCRTRLQLRAAANTSRDTALCMPYKGVLRDIWSHQDRNLPVLSPGTE